MKNTLSFRIVSFVLFTLLTVSGNAQFTESQEIERDSSILIPQVPVISENNDGIILADGKNLTPFQPTGWDDKLVLSTVTETNTSATNIFDNQTIYLDWAIINDGVENITETFTIQLYIDDILQKAWTVAGRAAGTYVYLIDLALGPFTEGTHNFRIVADALGNVAESIETDNEYARSFTISHNTCTDVNLIPYQPSGWDNILVLSTVTGTSTSAATFYDDQAIYLDWAVLNNGTCDILQITHFDLYVDDVLKARWYVRNLYSYYYVNLLDYAIGTLPAGSHSFRIVADTYGVVSESNESDNEYTRAINVQVNSPEPDINVIPTSLTISQNSGSSGQTSKLNSSFESPILSGGSSKIIGKLDSTKAHIKNDMIVKFSSSAALSVSVNPSDNAIQTGDFMLDQKIKELKILKMRPIYRGKNLPDQLKNTYLIRYKGDISLNEAVSKLKQLASVEWVDLNYVYPLYEEPNDPQYSQQWYLPRINASAAWDVGVGSPDVPIGIIDTGVDWNHPDLSSSIWINTAELPDNGIDDDQNGYIDDVRGWDWVDDVADPAAGEDGNDPDNDPMDFNGHGSHCSGLAAATTNNNTGIASISHGCSIMCLRAGYEDSEGNGYVQFAAAASAIEYAIINGARVISMSFGAGSELLDPVLYAYYYNLVVCHSAGNSNSSTPSPIDGIAETISVAATDQSDVKATFSNFGPWIDVSSPGISIYSTVFDDDYATYQGTSMSTPIVAGLAGLLVSMDPNKTAQQITNLIVLTTDNIDAVNPSYVGQLGTGRINALSAVNQVSNPEYFIIRNIGNADLSVTSISADVSWLSTTGHPGTPFTIPPSGSQNISLSVNWSQVGPETQTGTIAIASNDPDEQSVTVEITAVPLPVPAPEINVIPTSLTINQNGSSTGSSSLSETILNDTIPAPQILIPQIADSLIVKTLVDNTGQQIDVIIVPGYPPKTYRAPIAYAPVTAVNLNVPAFDWSFGCSATSAAMIAGFYDNYGYPNMYSGPTNGGVMPMTNEIWGTVVINDETRSQCPLSATRDGVDGRTTRGHVDDYWVKYGSTDPDPYITNGWIQHEYEDCTADFMKTNQSAFGISDAATRFYFYTNGSPLSDNYEDDGAYGLELFFESRGYSVTNRFSQYIQGYNGNTLGFTFNQYIAEIDAGRPVLIQVEGHTMVGYGYERSNNTVYLHDTWDYSNHEMKWGGNYYGLDHYGVSVFQLASNGTDNSFTIYNYGDEVLNISSITSDSDWLTSSGYPGTPFPVSPFGSQSVLVSVDWALVGSSPQTGIITITSNDLDEPSVTVYVTAVPLVCTLDVTPSGQTVPSSPAGSVTFSVTTDCSWTAASDQSWCTVTPSGSGNGTIMANYSLNTSGAERVANISVTVQGIPAVVVTLTQLAPAEVTQDIGLTAGWNIFSCAVEPDDMNMMTILNPLITAGTLVKVQDENGNALEQLPPPIGWINNIGLMGVSEGYKIRVTAATTLSVTGLPVSLPYNIPFDAGWNIMGYPSMSPQPALTAFNPLITAGTLVKVQDEDGNAIEQLPPPIGWVDNIHNLNPGEGYKIRTSISTSLDISNPAGKGEYISGFSSQTQPSHFRPSFQGNGLEQMNIYLTNLTPGAATLKVGDEIGVFDGPLCVGAAVVDDPTSPYFMVKASLDDPETSAKDGFSEGHRFEIRIWDNTSGTELKAQKVGIEKGYSDLFEKSGTSVLNASSDMIPGNVLGDAYPNPSSEMTTFTFTLAEEAKVRLELVNAIGNTVKILMDQSLPAGSHRIEWDNFSENGKKAAAGIYFYRLRINNTILRTKILIIH